MRIQNTNFEWSYDRRSGYCLKAIASNPEKKKIRHFNGIRPHDLRVRAAVLYHSSHEDSEEKKTRRKRRNKFALHLIKSCFQRSMILFKYSVKT